MEMEKVKKDTIERLRKVKVDNGLTIAGIVDLLESRGSYISESTLKRMFSENADAQSFKYSTIAPVADALLDLYQDDSGLDDLEALKAIIREKNRTIALLMNRDEERKEDYEERIKKLERQVEKLDEHLMFRERVIQRKDAVIEKLLNKVIGE